MPCDIWKKLLVEQLQACCKAIRHTRQGRHTVTGGLLWYAYLRLKLDLDLVVPLGVLGGFNEQRPEGDGYKRYSKLIAHLACEDCSNNNR